MRSHRPGDGRQHHPGRRSGRGSSRRGFVRVRRPGDWTLPRRGAGDMLRHGRGRVRYGRQTQPPAAHPLRGVVLRHRVHGQEEDEPRRATPAAPPKVAADVQLWQSPCGQRRVLQQVQRHGGEREHRQGVPDREQHGHRDAVPKNGQRAGAGEESHNNLTAGECGNNSTAENSLNISPDGFNHDFGPDPSELRQKAMMEIESILVIHIISI